MKCMERMIHKVQVGKWPLLRGFDGRFDAVEKRLGFPSPRRYRCIIGASDVYTRIVERDWDSMAAFEAGWEKALADPEHQALAAELGSVVLSIQWELYQVE